MGTEGILEIELEELLELMVPLPLPPSLNGPSPLVSPLQAMKPLSVYTAQERGSDWLICYTICSILIEQVSPLLDTSHGGPC